MMWVIIGAIGVVGLWGLIEFNGRNHPSTLMLRRYSGKKWNQEQLFDIVNVGKNRYRFDFYLDENRIIRGVLFDQPDKFTASQRNNLEEPKENKKDITHKVPGILICGKPIKSIRFILKYRKQASYWIEYADNPLLLFHYMEDRRWSGSIAKKVGL